MVGLNRPIQLGVREPVFRFRFRFPRFDVGLYHYVAFRGVAQFDRRAARALYQVSVAINGRTCGQIMLFSRGAFVRVSSQGWLSGYRSVTTARAWPVAISVANYAQTASVHRGWNQLTVGVVHLYGPPELRRLVVLGGTLGATTFPPEELALRASPDAVDIPVGKAFDVAVRLSSREHWPDQPVHMMITGGGSGLIVRQIRGSGIAQGDRAGWEWRGVGNERTAVITLAASRPGEYALTLADSNSYNQPSVGVLVEAVRSPRAPFIRRMVPFVPGAAALATAALIAVVQRRVRLPAR